MSPRLLQSRFGEESSIGPPRSKPSLPPRHSSGIFMTFRHHVERREGLVFSTPLNFSATEAKKDLCAVHFSTSSIPWQRRIGVLNTNTSFSASRKYTLPQQWILV
ncbi:hypothetical protein Y032_0221g2563 [Ancylostoma ceylanicum]|uniref:Uncharacterized protein n=1 Tax=Ancylostoma ceylanicum TaxID=53326 RepID=A0A016SJ36_9BILA|nr:hypothetical protein Y032_0221g2563 [Ancylostoma ceylanicum]